MNILIIQGPNLNLLGLRSAQLGSTLTLDKINKGIRRHVRNTEHTVKIIQTHKVDHAIAIIQRNRNRVRGMLLAPTGWALHEFALRQTVELIQTPVIEIHFTPEYQLGIDPLQSIFREVCRETLVGSPDTIFQTGIDHLLEIDG